MNCAPVVLHAGAGLQIHVAVGQAFAVGNVEGLAAHQQHKEHHARSKHVHGIAVWLANDDLRGYEPWGPQCTCQLTGVIATAVRKQPDACYHWQFASRLSLHDECS